jgi:hypothetical protein
MAKKQTAGAALIKATAKQRKQVRELTEFLLNLD